MSDIIDQLSERPGLYVGTQVDPTGSHPSGSVARIQVHRLPGGAGVSMDYESLSADGGRGHDEHAVLARTPSGNVLITAHSHASVATILHESAPGSFTADNDQMPFPMAIRLEVPEPGRLVYSWSYAAPGQDLAVRDVGSLTLITG